MQLNLSSLLDWSPFLLCVELVSEFCINNNLNLDVKNKCLGIEDDKKTVLSSL